MELDPQTVLSWLGVGGGGAALVVTLSAARRKASRDGADVAKDGQETGFVDRLVKEHEATNRLAREAMQARQVDAASIARLTQQTLSQSEHIQRLNADAAAFKRRIVRMYPTTREFVESEFYAGPDLPEAPPRSRPGPPFPPPVGDQNKR